jgi:XapX domain-containing protein
MRLVFGFLLAFGIGSFCRFSRIPSPAPQAIIGSLLVVAMSTGYVLADHLMERRNTPSSVTQSFTSQKENTHASH